MVMIVGFAGVSMLDEPGKVKLPDSFSEGLLRHLQRFAMKLNHADHGCINACLEALLSEDSAPPLGWVNNSAIRCSGSLLGRDMWVRRARNRLVQSAEYG